MHAGRRHHGSICRRQCAGISVRGRSKAISGSNAGTSRQIRTGAAPGENAADSVSVDSPRTTAQESRIRKPETFDFLGFTHCCAKTRHGDFKIVRLTIKKRMRATLAAIRDALKRKRHDPVGRVGAWLTRALRGYFNYHAVPDNLKRLAGFRLEVCRVWLKQLRRRGQKHKMTWALFGRLAEQYLPIPRLVHPYPSVRFAS